MMQLPEVEPLGDVRWARIEQSLMQRLEEIPAAEPAPVLRRTARSRVWPVALVATFAVSAAAAVALHVTRPQVQAAPMAMGASVKAATSRVVTESSPSHVTIADNSLDVSPESGIVVTEEEHATVLTLERGEVALHVAPRPKDRPFLVEAGDVQVRVVGTEFTVRRVGVGATVSVRHGVVEVRERGELAVVKGGERWPAPAQDLAPVSPPTPPLADVTPPPPPVLRPAFHSRPAPSPPPPTQPASVAEPVPAPPELAVAPPSPPLEPLAPSAQSQYESAAQLERSDPARALHVYTDLARGSDAWAQNALYAAGRLQADRGAREDAARLLEEYLRRFPRGSNAQDARALRESLR
jgi:hypothetical protein